MKTQNTFKIAKLPFKNVGFHNDYYLLISSDGGEMITHPCTDQDGRFDFSLEDAWRSQLEPLGYTGTGAEADWIANNLEAIPHEIIDECSFQKAFAKY